MQRSFNFTRAVYQFLAKSQTIRCMECGASFSTEQRDSFEFYKWQCPECKTGTCSLVTLGEEFKAEVENLNDDLMLEKVELEILEVLREEQKRIQSRVIRVHTIKLYKKTCGAGVGGFHGRMTLMT